MKPYTLAITSEAIAAVAVSRPAFDETRDRRLMHGEYRRVTHFDVELVEQVPRTMRYLKVADKVCTEMLAKPPLCAIEGSPAYAHPDGDWHGPRPTVLVDVGGSARPLIDLLQDRGVWPLFGVGLVDADSKREISAAHYKVAEREPIARLAALLQRGRVRFPNVKHELVRTAILSASAETPNAGPVLAIALAVWFAESHSESPFGTRSDLGLRGFGGF